MNMKCIYYGDCPYITIECQEDDSFFLCQYRKIEKSLCCADCSCTVLIQPCEACSNFTQTR